MERTFNGGKWQAVFGEAFPHYETGCVDKRVKSPDRQALLRSVIQDLHPIRVNERLPPQLDARDALQALEKALPDEHVPVPTVVPVPIYING